LKIPTVVVCGNCILTYFYVDLFKIGRGSFIRIFSGFPIPLSNCHYVIKSSIYKIQIMTDMIIYT